MSNYIMHIGQAHANLHNLIQDKAFSDRSSAEKIMPDDALNLLKANHKLKPTCGEECSAKLIGHIIGGALPLVITALFGAAIYGLYITGAAYYIYSQAIAVIGPLAQSLFNTMTQNAASMAISGGSFLVAGIVLTRPVVYEAIGAFFGSCCGSCCGSITAAGFVSFFSNVHATGYNWWYNKYQFEHRQEKIKENHISAIKVLKDTYDDMSQSVKSALEKDKNTPADLKTLKEQASLLQKKLPSIQYIFHTYGIDRNEFEEITLQFDKEIQAIVNYQHSDDNPTF
jgi:hypothetical protein